VIEEIKVSWKMPGDHSFRSFTILAITVSRLFVKRSSRLISVQQWCIIASMSWIESVRNRIREHSLGKDISNHFRTGGSVVVRIKNQPPITVDPVDIIKQMLDVPSEGNFLENFMEAFRKEVDERVFNVMRQHPGEEATLTFLDQEKRVVRDYKGPLRD